VVRFEDDEVRALLYARALRQELYLHAGPETAKHRPAGYAVHVGLVLDLRHLHELFEVDGERTVDLAVYLESEVFGSSRPRLTAHGLERLENFLARRQPLAAIGALL